MPRTGLLLDNGASGCDRADFPGESGIERRRGIARRWPELPVILLSGFSAEGPAEFAARTPNTTFIEKPFAAERLLALVKQTLDGAAAR